MKNHELQVNRISNQHNNSNSVIDKRKIISQLQAALQEQIYKRQEIERTLMEYRKRSIFIQTQFGRVLEKLDNRVAIMNGHDTHSNSSDVFNKLLEEIEKFNNNSQKMLDKRCGQIQFLMTRRVNQILDKTEIQIKKHKKLSQEEYKDVKQQIKEALKIAKDIQNQNEILKKRNKDLQFRLNLLNEQKILLVEELNQKKMKLKIVLKQVYQQDHQYKYQSKIYQSVHEKTARPASKDFSPSIKFMCEPTIKDLSMSLENPQFPHKRSSMSKRKNISQMIVKTQAHLKLCFDREKRKNSELKALLNNLNGKIKEIGFLIQFSRRDDIKQQNEQKIKTLQDLLQKIKLKLLIPSSINRAYMSEVEMQELFGKK